MNTGASNPPMVCVELTPERLFDWAGGLVWFTLGVPDKVDDPTTRTDAIVVLTGGSRRLGVGRQQQRRDLSLEWRRLGPDQRWAPPGRAPLA